MKTPTSTGILVLPLALSNAAACHAFGASNRPASFGRGLLKVRGGNAGSTARASTTVAAEAAETTSFAEISSSYAQLVKKLQTITHLQRANAVLSYDQLVFMPQSNPSTAQERGAQMAALATVVHSQSTDPALLDLMNQAKKDLDEHLKTSSGESAFADELRLLELELKSFEQSARVPAELATKAAELSSSAYGAWVQARTDSSFESFEPVLGDCFQTAQDLAAAKLGGEEDRALLYTQMLDEFERGMSKARIDEIFGEVQGALVPLISKVLGSETPPSTDLLNGNFPVDSQQALSQEIVTALGFELDRGRIDVSVHPFTTSFSPSDVRITSRFREDEWYQGLAGTVHEGGHAMYEQNMGGKVGETAVSSGLSIDNYLSMGTHESQSLFWERHIGLSKPFWRWATPLFKKHLATEDDDSVTPEALYGAVNAVSESLIRVEADELTYPLHVILRYQIESDVVEGKLAVKDIPQRWNQAMKDSLGVTVPSDDKGCLQDVHWSALAIGYFPTYLIGAIAAAQLAHYAAQDIGDFEGCIERGEFQSIKDWLTSKVHQHGRRYESLDAMFESELGESLNPKYFIDYLTDKYTDLYKL